MSDRPTPETDRIQLTARGSAGLIEDYEKLCLKLERSRDEAVELLTMYRASHNTCIVNSPQGLCNKCRITEAYLARLEKEKSC